MLPEGWRRMTLGEFVSIQRGHDLTESQREKGSIPVIGGGGVNGLHNAANVIGPGVVLGRSGAGFGTAFYCATDFWAHNTGLFVTNFHGNDPKFVFYKLDHIDFRPYNSGGAQPSLNRNFIYPIEIIVPAPPEQRKITQTIEMWDRAIDLTERLIAAKERRFSWLIKSLISDRCHGWEHLRTDRIFKSISDKVHNGEKLLSVTQDRGVIPRSMLEGRVMSPESGTDSYKLIQVGDFAISLRSFQGGIEYSRYRGLISPAYTVLRPKTELHDEFFRHFFKSYLFIKRYLNIAVIGIRDGKQISIPDFMTVKIPMPPLSEQKQTASVLNIAQQEIDLLRKQADALREQKKGLMQQLLTGMKRVKVSPAEATTEEQL
jgi:type I restriction enzyme S subunit